MSIKFAAARFTEQEALLFHSQGKPGKLEITPTKPLTTQRDLSLAYSPGVAVPVLAIAKDPRLAYDYTNKGNLVAVVSNGTAILGLGNLGAQAAKPVMEGKGALFKRFADIDGIDILVDTPDVEAVINCVRYLGPSFGGINLEDIKAPDCFIIEERLKELLDIPVFHDDQHGTAIIAAAGLLNALELTGRGLAKFKLVVNGAGAASIACMELLASMGMPKSNMMLCDTKGVIYRGRKEGMNQWKSAFAVETKARTLAEALKGADAFFGLSAAGTVTKEMVKSMADKPIIFAMANPDPDAGWLHSIFSQVRHAPKRIIFTEGEQPPIARAANAFHNAGLGRPILIGRHAPIKEAFATAGIGLTDVIEMHDTSLAERRHEYAE